MDIYIHKSGRDLGPFTLERVKEGLAHGDFSRSDHAWREGLADWIPLGDIVQSAAAQAQPLDLPAAPLPAGGAQQHTAHIFVVRNGTALGPFTAAEVISQMNAGIFTAADVAKHSGSETLGPVLAVPGVTVAPVSYATRTRSPSADAAAFGSMVFAGFWVRFAAYMVDGFVLYLPYLVIKLPLLFILHSLDANDPAEAVGIILLSILNSAALLIMYWLYYAISEASLWQATIGKKLFVLQVVDLNGQRLTFGRASGRFFAKLLSLLTLGIGCIMVACTERKQALHDFMAATLVIRGRTPDIASTKHAACPTPNVMPKIDAANTIPPDAAPPHITPLQQNATSRQSPSPASLSSSQPRTAYNPSLPPALTVIVIAGVIGLVALLFVQSTVQSTHNAPTAHSNNKEDNPVLKLVSMTPAQAYAYGYGQIMPQFNLMMENVKDDLYPRSVLNQSRTSHGGTALTRANVASEMRKACAEVEQDQEVNAELRSKAARAGVSSQVLESYFQGRNEGVIALNQPVTGHPPANGASPTAPPPVVPSEDEARQEDDTKVAETSPLGDLVASRSSGQDNDGEIWLDCADDSRRTALLCNHDRRAGQVSFSPDEKWIVVTDGGGPGSSMGTELRAFRREYQNVYTEVPNAGIAEAATRTALRSKHVPDATELGHVYAEVEGWSADGQRLKLSVWGHGPGYPEDGRLEMTQVDYSMAALQMKNRGKTDDAAVSNSPQVTDNSVEDVSTAAAARDRADAELNEVYKRVMGGLAPAQQKLLREDERAWLKWRDGEAERVARSSSSQGDGYRVKNLIALTDLIQKRSQTLAAIPGKLVTSAPSTTARAVDSAPSTGLQKRLPNGAVADPYANYTAIRPQSVQPSEQPRAVLSRVYTIPELKKLVGTRPAGAGLRGDFVLVSREGNQLLLQSRVELSNFGITSTTNGQPDVYRGHTFVTVNGTRDMSRFINGQLVTIPAEQALRIIAVSKNGQGRIDVQAAY